MNVVRYPHWPVFDDAVGPSMSDTALLGLSRYTEFGWDFRIAEQTLRKLLDLGSSSLATMIEASEVSLEDRLAAGTMLAIIGDPRISTFAPSMVEIPGGMVDLGSSSQEVEEALKTYSQLGLQREWLEKETPRHRRTLARYRIGKYPVTNQEYRDFLRAMPDAEIPTGWRFGRYPQEFSNCPVFSITAESADSYAAWLSEKTGRRFRLPSEEEWEFAAAGPNRCEFPWGNTFDFDACNTCELGLFRPTPIGAFPKGRSPFGLVDMAGNVEEYTSDNYRPYDGGPEVIDDLQSLNHGYRVARGGSFTRFRDLARTRRRHGRYPREVYVMGFRLAEDF